MHKRLQVFDIMSIRQWRPKETGQTLLKKGSSETVMASEGYREALYVHLLHSITAF